MDESKMQRNTMRKEKRWKDRVPAAAEEREDTVKIGGGKRRV